jgi:acyl-CoA thioesterase I
MRLFKISLLAIFAAICVAGGADAEERIVVALGAGFTYGTTDAHLVPVGVDPGQAYPAQLQALIQAKGVEARVINAARTGETTRDVLQRIDVVVPRGASLVILEGDMNDRFAGLERQTKDNIDAILTRLGGRNIPVIIIPPPLWRSIMADPSLMRGSYPNTAGQAKVADWLLPHVLDALAPK